jgi:hypothetical protein
VISLGQRLHCLPILTGGVALGGLLAVVAHVRGGTAPLVGDLVVAVPFLLAAMTGVAKTTTA